MFIYKRIIGLSSLRRIICFTRYRATALRDFISTYEIPANDVLDMLDQLGSCADQACPYSSTGFSATTLAPGEAHPTPSCLDMKSRKAVALIIYIQVSSETIRSIVQ